jgi:predicted nicotinamide N-methyase
VLTTNVQTVRGLKILTKKNPALKKLLDESEAPEIHGDKVWFSSYFIIDHLETYPPRMGSRIMEIGCGWGLLSISCAQKFKAKVTAVDADKHVFPFLDLHAQANEINVTSKVCRYENLKPALLAKQDMIVGGDICFWDELVEPLYQLIVSALDQGVDRIVLADPGRPPFLKLARRCKKLHGAKLKSVSISSPRSHSGYLLTLQNNHEQFK